MRARVKERSELAAATAHEDDIATAHRTCNVVALIGQLRRVTQVELTLREDQLLLTLENCRIAVRIAMNTKPTALQIDGD